ncbi:hypothetical protein [Flavobacterium segetis]|nr:hypothetical protein [Flavobacterium segetis]
MMDLSDFYKKKNKYQKKQAMQRYYQNDVYQKDQYQGSRPRFDPLALLASLRNNRKLKVVLLFILIIVIAIIVGLLAIVIPLIDTIFNYISQNGVAGIADEVIKFLNNLWNGAK